LVRIDLRGPDGTVETAPRPEDLLPDLDRLGDATLHELLIQALIALAVVTALAALLGWLVAGRVLRPIRAISATAQRLSAENLSERVPVNDPHDELAALAATVNGMLDRIQAGVASQKLFTANAAHELRTPLAIVTGALEAMDPSPELDKLKLDVVRMNRLVEQLLSVARLDAIALDVSGTVDLNDVARQVVANMAPWALAQSRRLAFDGAAHPIVVRGNVHAIDDAVRNLVENAVAHAPAGSEVIVSSRPDGRIEVSDCGPGVPPQDRERIFERFWRGKAAPAHGAGLGLAIVAEIMKAHGGRAEVNAGAECGAVFTLTFSPVAAPRPTAR
jgi:two-component system, OmpR family, sensor histidine kinase TctE